MISHEEAEELANNLMAAYIKECGCSTTSEMGDALMKLASLAGLGMAVAEGTETALMRLEGTARHVAKAGIVSPYRKPQ